MNKLLRQSLGEFIGTLFLVAVIIGSGIAAQRLSPNDTGLQLLENSLAVGFGLMAVIYMVMPISGAHLNPIVSIAYVFLGKMPLRQLVAYIVAQIAGAVMGAIVGNAMFQVPFVSISTHARGGYGLWLGEVVASYGLLFLIFSLRSVKNNLAPFVVGAYIASAFWFTSSTSFANPAVTIGRAFSNTFAGISPASVLPFIASQLVGLVVALVSIRYFFSKEKE